MYWDFNAIVGDFSRVLKDERSSLYCSTANINEYKREYCYAVVCLCIVPTYVRSCHVKNTQ